MLTSRMRRWWRSAEEAALAFGEVLGVTSEIEKLELRVIALLADLWHRRVATATGCAEDKATMQITRILISGDEQVRVTGTEDQINTACARMASRTKTCVTVAVIVGHYHRKGCDERPAGGLQMVGN